MKRIMKKIVLSLIGILICSGDIISAAVPEIALVMKCRGLVSVDYPGEQRHAMIGKGYLILPGARIQTGTNGFTVIKYIGSRSEVVVRPRSEVICNACDTEQGTGESLEMRAGEALLDIHLPPKHSFDLYTAAALVSFRKKAQTLVILSRNGQGTALYNLSGEAQIADNNFTTWRSLNAETAAFAAPNGFVQLSKLPKKAVPRLKTIFESTRKLSAGPSLVNDLVIKAGPNGTVTPSGRIVALSGVAVDITAEPEAEYLFTGWKVVDGNAYVNNIAAPQTQVSVTSNALLEARFDETPSLLRIVKSPYGATDPAGDLSVQKGVPVMIRLAPNRGYGFAGWKTGSNITIEDVDILATAITLNAAQGKIFPRFKRKTYSLGVLRSEYGTVTPEDSITVNHGDSTAITAVPHEGFYFIRWDIVEGDAVIVNPYSASTQVVCDSVDAVVQPLFSNNAVEVSILDHELAESVEPVGNFYVVRNSLLTLQVVPKAGKMVSRWTVERGRAQVEGREHAVVKCKTPFEIKPVITEQEFTVTLLSGKHGVVEPSGSLTALYNRPVTITATPHEGMHFIRWKLSGGWADINDPYRDSTYLTLIHGDAVVKAEFAETICTLNVTASKGGYTEPSGPINNYEGGDIILQAIPNPHAAFIGWEILDGEDNILFSDTLTIAEQTVTSIKNNASIRALFSTETVAMTVLTNGLGTTLPEGKSYAVQNKWIPLTAVPNEEQSFVQWTVISGNDVQIRDPLAAETEVNPGTDEVVIKALFQSASLDQSSDDAQDDDILPDSCTLRIVCDKSKGTIDTDEKITVKTGTPIVITATPKDGYVFEEWSLVNGKALLSDKTAKTVTVALKKEDAVISPLFRLKPLHTLEIRFRDYEGASRVIRSTYR